MKTKYWEDVFAADRARDGMCIITESGEDIPLLLGYKAVRAAAKDWQKFSSNAPFRVPIPSEEDVRTTRQIPIELDPPLHTAFRKKLEPIFRQPTQPAYIARVEALIYDVIEAAKSQQNIDIVHDFALPIQTRALTYLLAVAESEAEVWAAWGTSLFREGNVKAKGAAVDDYIKTQLDRARANCSKNGSPAEDFFSRVSRMDIEGRPLTEDEMVGICNLTFAGGRDTVINAVVEITRYFAQHRDALMAICENPRRVNLAVEEFVRVLSPVTFIGRVCPVATPLGERVVKPNGRVGLCWAGANYDPDVFEDPQSLRLNRMPNPHIGFGSGVHACIGATQARLIMRSLIRGLAAHTQGIDLISQIPADENIGTHHRQLGFERVTAKFS